MGQGSQEDLVHNWFNPEGVWDVLGPNRGLKALRKTSGCLCTLSEVSLIL